MTYKHGMYKSPEYLAWLNMIYRCTRPNHTAWANYGGRGITVCDEWRNDFMAFLAHVGKKPSPNLELDRKDNSGNYEPGNVQWATPKDQCRNRRGNRLITVDGQTECVSYFAQKFGISQAAITYRLRSGWTPEHAVKLRPGQKRPA